MAGNKLYPESSRASTSVPNLFSLDNQSRVASGQQ
jgi:hypothetical protein